VIVRLATCPTRTAARSTIQGESRDGEGDWDFCAGGGVYNEEFKRRLTKLGRVPTADDVTKIRDELALEFELEEFRP